MMAASIVVPHAVSSIPLEHDLSVVLECEELLLMSQARSEELAATCSIDYPLASAYLHGLFEHSQFGVGGSSLRLAG
jgi:hypothetical protein